MNNIKYEYMLQTWGGFYNKEFKDLHHEIEGYKWFDTVQDRDLEITRLKNIEITLNARYLAISLEEGYHTRIETICHRVVRFKNSNNNIYSELNMGYGYPISAAKYHMEYKWTPGFNDYEAIQDDKDLNKIEIIAEWITGAEINIK
jgi:hypothetical protein